MQVSKKGEGKGQRLISYLKKQHGIPGQKKLLEEFITNKLVLQEMLKGHFFCLFYYQSLVKQFQKLCINMARNIFRKRKK